MLPVSAAESHCADLRSAVPETYLYTTPVDTSVAGTSTDQVQPSLRVHALCSAPEVDYTAVSRRSDDKPSPHMSHYTSPISVHAQPT